LRVSHHHGRFQQLLRRLLFGRGAFGEQALLSRFRPQVGARHLELALGLNFGGSPHRSRPPHGYVECGPSDIQFGTRILNTTGDPLAAQHIQSPNISCRCDAGRREASPAGCRCF
jgi:hypothetical protein